MATTNRADEQVDVNKLLRDMDFTEETITTALLNQSKLLVQASRYRVQKMRERMQAEAELEHLSVDVASIVRQRGDSEVRITEKFIEEQVLKNQKVRGAQSKFDDARVLEEWAKLLLQAFDSRGSMLKALVQLLGAEAAVESGFIRNELERMGIGKLREKVRKGFPGALNQS